MADSDGEYVDNASDDDFADHQVTRERGEDRQGPNHGPGQNHGQGPSQHHGRQSSRKGGMGGGGGDDRRQKRRERREGQQAAWETVKRSWDTVGEAEDGQVLGVEFLAAAEKRRRVLRDTTPLQRGIIRHVVLVLDMSAAMSSRDYLPSCQRVALDCAADFVRAFFEQNPISQLAVVAMRDGVALRVSDMGGSPAEHLDRLADWDGVEPQGQPSLQNALEMCRGALFHTPAHGTREVLVVFGALLSSDPADIHDTIAALVADRIRVSIVGLAAKVAVCAEICARTNPGDEAAYAVARHDVHFHELVLAATTPPATRPDDGDAASTGPASLLMMGFPSRAIADTVAGGGGLSVCACHSRPVREGYGCTRCGAKVCRLPAECPACGLTLILSTHLARSYHHLFPLRSWVEVSWTAAADAVRRRRAVACHACLTPFPAVDTAAAAAAAVTAAAAATQTTGSGVSESGRYACEVCGHHFCIDCDVFAHEVIHNCPGCQSDTRPKAAAPPPARIKLVRKLTASHGDMVID
ncbi:suppressor of stem-loop protein 1 [Grosmannia clavigera kw1407]|uniref:General transcription and DNA repair factor IIH n=1 Tax=Grosmannia clavigera (strain kw1407 / UAMH 11150) TaxID=655863 RepID=F0XU06_GROCL|nr:suppressor of stem-loop protein 1 [Grosmannia clavigera kw1407]EFW98563.1 suppressor of stem-loop protein 1 [Grosmannia clavigera kw1407]